LPHLGPSGQQRCATDGSESLGAHCEGPFISTQRNGIHTLEVLQAPENGLQDLERCYGRSNLAAGSGTIKYITLAPELPGARSAIRALRDRGIGVSIGHTAATYEEAQEAMGAGSTMITHLFNAMNPLHHRDPALFGLLGQTSKPDAPKPFFGIIADGYHLHSSAINIAWNAHPDGFILVTDAMSLVGLPDGTYNSANSDRIVKVGSLLKLEGSDKIAGSSISLIECINNFLRWGKASIACALRAATGTPARMLGVYGIKGCLLPGADADLVVLNDILDKNGRPSLEVLQVWKFGQCVHGS
jgi:N-acetylglucosamine-6-phosphate deacetylase